MGVGGHLHSLIWLDKALPKNVLKRVLWNSSFPFIPRYIALSFELRDHWLDTDFAEQKLFKQVHHEYYKGSVWLGRVITMDGEPLLAVRIQVCLPPVNSFSPWGQLSVERCNWSLPAQRGDGQNALCAKWELQQVPNWMSLTVCSHPGIHTKSCVQKIKISNDSLLINSSEVSWILQMTFWASQFKKKLESKKVTKLAGVWGKHNWWQRLEDVEWLSLTVERPNYLKGRIERW